MGAAPSADDTRAHAAHAGPSDTAAASAAWPATAEEEEQELQLAIARSLGEA